MIQLAFFDLYVSRFVFRGHDVRGRIDAGRRGKAANRKTACRRLHAVRHALVACLVVAWIPACSAAPLNFLILIADDLGWGDAGFCGHPTIRTPNLDRLARDGMSFEQAFLTCSSCSPSRSSILTGRYPHSTGASELHLPLPADQVVFAGLMKESGYYTAAAGKWHLGPAAERHFDRIYGARGESGCEAWLSALQERPLDKPFFLWLAAVDPHRGYRPGAHDPPHTPEEVVLPPFLPDSPEVRRDVALYYDEVGRLDKFVGQVLDELARQEIVETTFVLFLSDNGRPFPRCKTTLYDSGVRTPFIVRWPEKVPAGSRCHDLVSSVDIAPTILELAGLQSSPTFQGVSFVPLLSDHPLPVRDQVFAEHNWHDYQARERSVRTKQFLYIRNDLPNLPATPPADAVTSPTFRVMQNLLRATRLPAEQLGCFTVPRPQEELYDHVRDPHQLHNLARDPAYARPLEHLRQLQQQWTNETRDDPPPNLTPDGFDRITGERIIGFRHPSLGR